MKSKTVSPNNYSKPKTITHRMTIKRYKKGDDSNVVRAFFDQEKVYATDLNKPYTRKMFDDHLNRYYNTYPNLSIRYDQYAQTDLYNKIISEVAELYKSQKAIIANSINKNFKKLFKPTTVGKCECLICDVEIDSTNEAMEQHIKTKEHYDNTDQSAVDIIDDVYKNWPML
jgi:hypothetical protein